MQYDKPKYAYYSALAEQNGVHVTIHKKANGQEVKATCVMDSVKDIRDYTWSDKKFVGVVVSYERRA